MGGVCLNGKQKGQIGGSNVVWDDGNAGNTAQPASGFRESPPSAIVYAVPEFIWGMSDSISWIVVGGIVGAILGSFIDCARYRLPRGISLHRPAHSYCASCGLPLTPIDLVPIVSWLCLGGRCRRCKAPIGIVSLLVEFISASIGALLVLWLIAEH
jgi:hypothetical protein